MISTPVKYIYMTLFEFLRWKAFKFPQVKLVRYDNRMCLLLQTQLQKRTLFQVKVKKTTASLNN